MTPKQQGPSQSTQEPLVTRKLDKGKLCKKLVRTPAKERILSAEKKHQCSVCGKAFTTKGNKTVHEKAHSAVKDQHCSVCGKGFHRKSNKRSHEKTHFAAKEHVCSVCGKEFRTRGNLRVHMKRLHLNERPFECLFCQKKFAASNDMWIHIRVHTQEKPEICRLCGREFSAGHLLKSHQCPLKDNTPRPRVECVFCPKTFAKQYGLNCHLRAHLQENPHFCGVCGEEFGRKRNLDKHRQGGCALESSTDGQNSKGDEPSQSEQPHSRPLPEHPGSLIASPAASPPVTTSSQETNVLLKKTEKLMLNMKLC